MSELGDLPIEVAEKIFNDLGIIEVEKFCANRFKNRLVDRICFNQHSWKHFALRDFSELFDLQVPEDGDWRKYYYFLLGKCLISNSFLKRWAQVVANGGLSAQNDKRALIAEMLKENALLALEYIINTYYKRKYTF